MTAQRGWYAPPRGYPYLCVPGKLWCREGARLRDQANDARDRWLEMPLRRDAYVEAMDAYDNILDLYEALGNHIRRCSRWPFV